MSPEAILIFLIIFCLLMPPYRRERRHTPTTRVAPSPKDRRRPVTPEPRYICENCGMLIETGHGHTRVECENYNKERPFQPDHRCISYLGGRGRNDPKIRLPRYLEPGTFKNWGKGVSQ